MSVPLQQLSGFRRTILAWYYRKGRSFPWRNKSASKYMLIISELLLQRTRAETVSSFLGTFFSSYPSWKKLSGASEAEIRKVIQPIGLWKRRAPILKNLAIEISKRNGRFPSKRIDVEALPGVGQYIANAILLFCHGEAQPLLDAGMARVLERVFGSRKLADIRHDPYLQGFAFEIVQCKKAREINWAILDLAATTCLVRKPRCDECPLVSMCLSANGI